MKKLQANLSYSLIHASMWGMYAVIIYFAKTFLESQNLNGTQCSLVLGLTAAASVLLNIGVSELIKRTKKIKVYVTTILLAALILLGLGGMLVQNPVLALAGICLVLTLLQLAPGMCNSLGMDAIAKGAPANYAVARGIGSFAFATVTLCAGMLIETFSEIAIPAVGGGAAVILILAVIWFHLCAEKNLPDAPLPAPEAQAKKKDNFLGKNPKFALFLVGAALMNISHYYLVVFLSDVAANLHLGSTEVGIAGAVSTYVELPIMFGFAFLTRKMRCNNLLRISCFMFLLKCFGLIFAQNEWHIYFAHATQIIGYGLYAIASVTYAGEVMGKDDAVRAQSYLAGTISIGNVVAMSTGALMDVRVMLWVSTGCALIGALIVAFTAANSKKLQTIK